MDAKTYSPNIVWKRMEVLWPSVVLFCVSLLIRIFFISRVDNHPFDQWRHYALVESIRSGRGFTLFDGQPYIWYSPLWYYFCAIFPRAVSMEYISTLLSSLSPPFLYLIVLMAEGAEYRLMAFVAGLLMALSGPHVSFTCHNGQEAAALFLLLGSVLFCSWKPGFTVSGISGVIFGTALTLRMNFVFAVFMFLPFLKRRVYILSLLSGIALPLLLLWIRNNGIVKEYQYIFAWDGLAIRSSDFNFFSTLVIQLVPDVQEGLRRLHEMIMPLPEWFKTRDGINTGMLVFIVTSVVCTLISKRLYLVLTLVATLGYFFLLDRTLSSHFLRMYLVLFPVFSVSVARAAFGRAGAGWRSATAGWLLVSIVLLSCVSALKPENRTPLAMLVPPEGLLKGNYYMVNGALYHPESLVYSFPGKNFIGMPLGVEGFEEFRKKFPKYKTILIHDFAVQKELIAYLFSSGLYRVEMEGYNSFGRRYTLLKSRTIADSRHTQSPSHPEGSPFNALDSL